jgi:hypothetical protein
MQFQEIINLIRKIKKIELLKLEVIFIKVVSRKMVISYMAHSELSLENFQYQDHLEIFKLKKYNLEEILKY